MLAKRRLVDEDKEVPAKKKGKQKKYYGVDNDRFLGKKPSAQIVKEISKTSEMVEFEQREAIFSKHRDEIQFKFRHDFFKRQFNTLDLGLPMRIFLKSVEDFLRIHDT